MKLGDVLTLIGAGYTKDEISLFEAMEKGKESVPQVEIHGDPPVPVPDPEPQEQTQPETPSPSTEELLAEVRALKAALQQGNIRNSQQPANVGQTDIGAEADKTLLELYNI